MSDLNRFSKAERRLHWTTVLSVAILAVTGWFIWRKEDDWEINGINVLSQSHVWVGALLLLVGAGLYLLSRRPKLPSAALRFNPGQRMSLRLTQALLGVMTVSGVALYLRSWIEMSKPVRTVLRQVHFFSGATLLALVALHVAMVLVVPKNRGLLRGMLTGRVTRRVALRSSPEWVARLEAEPSGS